jgi:hypothetical protein
MKPYFKRHWHSMSRQQLMPWSKQHFVNTSNVASVSRYVDLFGSTDYDEDYDDKQQRQHA